MKGETTMEREIRFRTSIPATGSFVSIPEAFEAADEAVKYAPKIEFRLERFDDSEEPLKMEPVMLPHTLLLDLEAVDANAFDPKKVMRDCDLIKEAAEKYPDQLQRILAAFAADAPHEEILKSAAIVNKLGLLEEQVTKEGGGLLFLLILAAALCLSGCKGCAHGKGSFRQ